jgi:hypothetical protein
MNFRGKVKTPIKTVQKDNSADSTSNTSAELRSVQQLLYLTSYLFVRTFFDDVRYKRLMEARKQIQITIHANDIMTEYMILSLEHLNDLSTSFPTNVVELTNILGDVKARKYHATPPPPPPRLFFIIN